MSTRYCRPRLGLWMALFALAAFCLPFTVTALQHQPPPPVTESTVPQPNVRVPGGPIEEAPAIEEAPVKEPEVQEPREKATVPEPPENACSGDTVQSLATGTQETEVIYRLGHMLNDPDGYIGKTITVDGEMHRQFTDRVFTIEDDGMVKDRDMLVISVTPMSESVIPLQGSFDRGKNVRVTGVLRPYDRGKLECVFGPLNLESREGHSFTHHPVLIIGYKAPPPPPAVAILIPLREKPEPEPETPKEPVAPPPAPAPAPPEPAAAPPAPAPAPPQTTEEPAKLPKTAGGLPFLSLAGVLFVCAACSVRLFRRDGVPNK